MKKGYSILCILLCFLLCGCQSMGSLEKGTLDLEKFEETLDEAIMNQEIASNVLQKGYRDEAHLSTLYQLSFQEVDAYIAKFPVVSLSLGEVAIFHVINNEYEKVENALQARKQRLLNDSAMHTQQKQILSNTQIKRIGEYVIFVTGSEAESMVQYISSFAKEK